MRFHDLEQVVRDFVKVRDQRHGRGNNGARALIRVDVTKHPDICVFPDIHTAVKRYGEIQVESITKQC